MQLVGIRGAALPSKVKPVMHLQPVHYSLPSYRRTVACGFGGASVIRTVMGRDAAAIVRTALLWLQGLRNKTDLCGPGSPSSRYRCSNIIVKKQHKLHESVRHAFSACCCLKLYFDRRLCPPSLSSYVSRAIEFVAPARNRITELAPSTS